MKCEFEFGFVSDMGLNLVDKYHRGLVHELIFKIWYPSDWLFSASIVNLSAMSEAEFFFLVLKCDLLGVISVHFRCFKGVLKVNLARTVTYYWVYQLQPGTSHLVLQPLNACSIYFDRPLMGIYTLSSHSIAPASNTLKSDVTFQWFHDYFFSYVESHKCIEKLCQACWNEFNWALSIPCTWVLCNSYFTRGS